MLQGLSYSLLQLSPLHWAFAFPLLQTTGALLPATRQSGSARPQHRYAVDGLVLLT